VSFPSLCLVAQGSKELRLGNNRYQYNPAHYLISSVALPIATWISEASPERPYLGLVLRLDQSLVGSVLVEAGQRASRSPSIRVRRRSFYRPPRHRRSISVRVRSATVPVFPAKNSFPYCTFFVFTIDNVRYSSSAAIVIIPCHSSGVRRRVPHAGRRRRVTGPL
jgi:AraC-type transcriptional regulator N-terminus